MSSPHLLTVSEQSASALPPHSSALLSAVQHLPESPFGMLFLSLTCTSLSAPLSAVVSTQTNEESSNDGKSKLDPIYDEDENEDEEIPEKY